MDLEQAAFRSVKCTHSFLRQPYRKFIVLGFRYLTSKQLVLENRTFSGLLEHKSIFVTLNKAERENELFEFVLPGWPLTLRAFSDEVTGARTRGHQYP